MQEIVNKTDILREKAKKLHQHGISTAEMSEILEIPYALICKWAKDVDFQEIQRLMRMRVAHMKRLLLDSFERTQAGELPLMSPAHILQYATAYEKLSEKKKHFGCWYEAYEALTSTLLDRIDTLSTTHAQNQALNQLKELRRHMTQLLKRLAETALDE